MKGWICYPLWGLELAENGFGLEKPLFGDATLVTRAFLQKYAPEHRVAAALLSGGGLREALEAEPATYSGPAPLERLIDIAPGAFIAVRRKNPEDAVRYAESIRSLLTASAVLTSGQAKGFATSPLPLHWAAIPSRLQLDPSERLEIDYKVIANSFIHIQPVRVTHKQLSESWSNGTPVHGTWTLHKEHALSRALTGDWGSLTPLRRRVRDASCILARAMEATDPTLSTLFGVVALESLLKDGSADFKEMEEMAAAVFQDPKGGPDIARLFQNRHKVAHEAISPQAASEHGGELMAAWAIILLAALAAEHVASPADLLDHLRGRVLARRVATRLREYDRNDLATEVEHVATMFRATKGKSE